MITVTAASYDLKLKTHNSQIFWLDSSEPVSNTVQQWARQPIFIDTAQSIEFHLSAALSLPEKRQKQLGKHYQLQTKVANKNNINSWYVSDAGLEQNHMLIPWQEINQHWPAIVFHATTIAAKEPSPLLAMALWLGKIDSPLKPLYKPAHFPQTINEQNIALDDTIQAIRLFCMEQINSNYQEKHKAQATSKKSWRLIKKLLRDPQQFWQDSQLRRYFKQGLHK